MSEEIHTIIDKNGLKIKLYIIDCPLQCSDCECSQIKSFQKNPKYDEVELSENLNDLKFLPYDLCREKAKDIFNELETSLFIGYSCVWIVINMKCFELTTVVTSVFRCLNRNQYLRYKSKLVQTVNLSNKVFQDFGYRLDGGSPIAGDIYRNRFSYHEYPHLLAERLLNTYVGVREFKNSLDIDEAIIHLLELYITIPENTIYLNSYIPDNYDIAIELQSILGETYNSPLTSIRRVLLKNTKVKSCKRIVMSSSMMQFYFYSINPALAIIINQYHFTSSHNREGSDLDVLRLIRELKVAAVPYILIEDCNKQQLFEILNYLRNKDLWPLKKLLVFVMSHGDSAGNIYTTDDKVHIMNDIVIPLQQNESLKFCTQLLSMVNCRGSKDATLVEYEEFEAITSTDNSSLRDYTVLLYSVPDQIKSPRSAQHGTPFIESFCKHFRTIYHNDCVKTLINDVNKTLKNAKYYRFFPNNAVELVCKETAANQSVKSTPIAATNMIRLLQSIATEMKELLRNGYDNGNDSSIVKLCIFGILYNNNALMEKYTSPQLDNDCCYIEEFRKSSK